MIHQALALCSSQQFVGSFAVCQISGVVAKIEFGEISVQVGFANIMERSHDAAFEKSKIAFDGICVPEIAAYIFAGTVVHCAVS